MKSRFIFLAAAALAALAFVSCEKQEELDLIDQSQEQVQGVPMTLNVSLGGDTKATYALDNGLLKTTWDASETISVITYKGTSIVAVNNFTYNGEAGVSHAAFSGTFTGGEIGVYDRVWLVYPALTETYDTEYHGSSESATNGNRTVYYKESGYLNYLYFGHMLAPDSHHMIQSASGNFDHIAEASAMMGLATVNGNEIDGTLVPQVSLLKVSLVLPSNYASSSYYTYLDIEAYDSSDNQKQIFFKNARYYLAGNITGDNSFYQHLDFGTYDGSYTPGGLQVTADDRTLVAYVPVVPNTTGLESGDKLKFVLRDGTLGEDYTATKTLSADFSFSLGSQYNMSINLANSSTPSAPDATNLSPSNQTANCYVIPSSTGAMYKFKNCKGTSYNYLNSTATTACVLWEADDDPMNAPSDGSIITSATLYDDGYVYIETTGARGNAVVAVKDGSDNILWSWHIWVTGDDFNPLTDYADDGGSLYWMKANLGALSYATDIPGSVQDARYLTTGLLYQYGRKDPFRGINQLDLIYDTDGTRPSDIMRTTNEASWTYVDCSAETGTVAYAHAHPMTFINGSDTNHAINDWVYAHKNDGVIGASDRWNSSNDDPCPYGWHVPTSSSLSSIANSGLTVNQDPYVWSQVRGVGVISDINNSNLYFPFAGLMLSDGIPQFEIVFEGSGSSLCWQQMGFYWATDGQNTTYPAYRNFLLLRTQYIPACNDQGCDNAANVRPAFEDFSVHNSSSWALESHSYAVDLGNVGMATGMSVRCVKQK